VWIGREIEGNSEIGVQTLFVRELRNGRTPESLKLAHPHIDRVWLCKELSLNAALLRAFIAQFHTCCIEIAIDGKTTPNLWQIIKAHCKVYLKIPIALNAGDFVCIGEAFNDEAFEIGTGFKVQPHQYLADIRID